MYKIFPVTLTHDGRKVPCIKGWQEKATVDQTQISSWSKEFPQLKFWGIPTGSATGLIALDVDVKGNGYETIKKYNVPRTLSQRTKSGGCHYIFTLPQDGKQYGNRVGFDSGLDIRADGGYICYYGFDSTPPVEAPPWLLELALNETKITVKPEDIVKISPEIVNAIIQSAVDNIINSPAGESNDVLNIESYRVGQLLPSGSIDREYAYSVLFRAAKVRGKPDYEAKATILSGFSGGEKSPLINPFGSIAPTMVTPVTTEVIVVDRWTPRFFTKYDLTNASKLRKPQLFKDWSTEDIHITTADGGTGKTTLKLNEAVCLALGEDFLGFQCSGEGRTLFITGEDSAEKLGATIGMILRQKGIIDDDVKVQKVLNNIIVKKDSDLCLITKGKDGFIKPNLEALEKLKQAVQDLKPRMIVFDPISSFWGSESALNDMSKAVSTFMSHLVEITNGCVEVINHMGKASSKDKDMSQFAGRGGTGLPSHSRVSRVLRPLFDDEFSELTGLELKDGQSAMICNVNKFSDGSPLYNKPFVIVREGYLFSRITLVEQKVKEQQEKMSDTERVFTYICEERDSNRYPSKDVITAHFSLSKGDVISKDRIGRAIAVLQYTGHMGEKIKAIENPDIEAGGKVYIVIDSEGKEI